MNYVVKLTNNAIAQIQSIVDYIAEDAQEPEIALRWRDKLKSEISKLSYMPGRVKLTDEEPYRNLGIHKLSYNSFLVYFWVDELEHVVWVTAVVYERRDQLSVLIDMPME